MLKDVAGSWVFTVIVIAVIVLGFWVFGVFVLGSDIPHG